MHTILITGGTSGIGEGLAKHYLAIGDQVIIVSRKKGNLKNAIYIQADLSLVSENYRLVKTIQESYGAIDGLILCAVVQTARKNVLITKEDLEFTFALQYLSRYILSNQIPFNENSFILNVATPGRKGNVDFDNLQYRRKFSSLKANIHANRLNDLLGVGFKRLGIRYILYSPMSVKTVGAKSAFANPLMSAFLKVWHKLFGHDVDETVNRIVVVLQKSSTESFSAYELSKPVDLSMKTFNLQNAKRLNQMIEELLLNSNNNSV
ncbi:SDR family NAD(P)-dependent oxidoreductase [Alkalicoccobacillus gibsonii]|uniref:SDR family NAD(P)-dependent oxidoreductase n=1 Tax=Alkalicoccobacillus gibsonii TaxID=79881 RepID=A0ABU9VER6_9BACI